MPVRDILYHPVSGKTNNLLLFIIALVPAFVLFPFPASVYSNGIDPPLAWVFNYFAQGHFSLGKYIIFPHGPLAFLMYPLPVGANLWIVVSVHLALRIFMAYSLLKLATRKPIGYLVLALISAFILLAINDLLLTIVQVIILCYLNFFERRNIKWLIPALIISPVTLYIKAFAGIVSLVVTVSFFGIMVYRTIIGIESRYRLLLFLIVPFVLLLAWVSLYGDFHGIAAFFKGMLDLAADNSAAVAVYPLNNWWWIGVALVCAVVLIAYNIKNVTLTRFAILVAPALFAIWKYGMAREDYLHTSMLFVFVLFIALVYTILSGKFRLINSILSVVIVVLFYFILQLSYYFEPFNIRTNGLQTLVTNAGQHHYFADTCNQSSAKAISRNKLDNKILDLIGNHTTDIYPWDYTYIAANHLNWQPRPVIQSYASYTRELDLLNATHFESDKAPEFIIWELRKITHDIYGGTLESIDGRYLLNDEPEALMAMLRHYGLVAKQQSVFPALVFRKRAEALKTETKTIGRTKASWNTWIDVPTNNQEILKASVQMNRSRVGKLKSFFYKDEATYVYYLLENGDIRMYRIVPKNAAYGLWISPLIINPETGEKEPAVKKIMFRSSNTAMMEDEFEIEWKQVSFTRANPITDNKDRYFNTVYSFFGITGDSSSAEVLVSQNDLDVKSAHWSSPDETKIVSTTKNRSLKLMPGDYSVSFEFALDSLPLITGSGERIIRASVWAKAVSNAKAVFVISIEKSGKSLLWKAVDIQNFILDPESMNFVTNYAIPGKEMLQQYGLILKVYAWNTGTEPVTLDDFSVRIEER
jgi:hypothetical protein